MSFLLSPSSTGEISQHRHGSFPQFPSILIISTVEGSGIRINVSKSDDFELHPVSNEDPDRKKRSIRDNPSPERMLTSCRLTITTKLPRVLLPMSRRRLWRILFPFPKRTRGR